MITAQHQKVGIGNVFDVNRLGISDYEAGRSLTLGLGYKFDSIELEENQN